MNQNIINLFRCTELKMNINIELHFWNLLEALANNIYEPTEGIFVPPSSDIVIELAPDDQRARKVVRRSNYKMTGKFPSRKNNRMMQWESHIEKMAFQLLEVAPFVLSYREQPATFKFHLDGIKLAHYPDLLVKLDNGQILFVEIKPNSAKSDLELQSRTRCLQFLLKNRGYRYLLVYEDQLDNYGYLENALQILMYPNTKLPYPIKEKIENYLQINKGVTYKTLSQMLLDRKAKAWIYKMLTEGHICCDMSNRISDDLEFILRRKN